MTIGRVTSWRRTKGWGALWTPELTGRVWAHFGDLVEMGELARGDYVTFEFEDVTQNTYSHRALWVRRLDGADGCRAREYLHQLARWQGTGIGSRPERPPGLDRRPLPRASTESGGAYRSTLTAAVTYQLPSTKDEAR